MQLSENQQHNHKDGEGLLNKEQHFFLIPNSFSIFASISLLRIVSNQDHSKRIYTTPESRVRELNLEPFCQSGTIDGYHFQDDYDWGEGDGGQG